MLREGKLNSHIEISFANSSIEILYNDKHWKRDFLYHIAKLYG